MTIPSLDNGNSTEPKRCPVVLKNDRICGKEENPDRPGVCRGGHFWKSNNERGISAQRLLEKDAERWIIPTRDRFLRDAGHSTIDSAPLEAVLFFTTLAQTYRLLEHAQRKGRVSESAQLLQRLATLLGMRTQFRAAMSPRDRFANELEGKSDERLIEEAKRQVSEYEAMVADLAARAALPDITSEFALPSLQTQSNSPSRNIGVATGGSEPLAARRSTPTPDPYLPSAPPEIVSRAAVLPAASEPEPSPDSAPRVFVYKRLVTERDVRNCLTDTGDLEAYDLGKISKPEAYERTRRWLKAGAEMPQ